jgi:hypothetical protein
MLRIPLSAEQDVQIAFREVETALDLLGAPLVDLHLRRFVNGGSPVQGSDFVTLDSLRNELDTRGLTPQPESQSPGIVLRDNTPMSSPILRFAQGSVLFVGLNSNFAQDRGHFYYDDANNTLEVRGAGAAAALPGILQLTTAEETVVDGDVLGRVDFLAPAEASGTDAILLAASIYAEADNPFSSSVNEAELVFATAVSGAATEKMRLTKNGRLGIGTATPVSLLDVQGTVTINGATVTLTQDTNFEVSGGVNGVSFDGTTLSVDGANNRVGFGTAAPGFQVDIKRAGGARFFNIEASSSGASYVYGAVVNDGGQTYFGLESSGGGSIFTGSLAYASILGANTNTALQFATNGSIRVTVDPSGNMGMNTTTFGSSASGVLAILNGTQGAALSNAVQLISEDLSSGNTILSLRCEGSGVVATGTPSAANGAIAIKVNGTVRYLTYSNSAPT